MIPHLILDGRSSLTEYLHLEASEGHFGFRVQRGVPNPCKVTCKVVAWGRGMVVVVTGFDAITHSVWPGRGGQNGYGEMGNPRVNG